MTVEEAKEIIIGAMNYAAYKETPHSLWTEDKNRLFGSTHFVSDRTALTSSVWAENFEAKMVELLRWASRLQSKDPKFKEAVYVLRDGNALLSTLIQQSGIR